MVNFITYFSVGADNWLVANPRDMDGFIKTLSDAKPTVFMGVNTLYAGLVAHPGTKEVDFPIFACRAAGVAVIAAVSEKWREVTGQNIREGYGLSETSPVLTFNPMHLDGILWHHRRADAVDRYQAFGRGRPRGRARRTR